MFIYDTKQRKKVRFEPISKDILKIYVCGPTVYDNSHLGHARSAIVFDILRNTLNALGFKIEFVKNFTDIDDKIVDKAQKLNLPINEVSQKYINSYLKEMDCMLVKRADKEPKVTDNLDEIFNFIKILLQKDIAYQICNGDIYLDITKDKSYGTLSKRLDDDAAVSRVSSNKHKRNKEDFALWKSFKSKEDIGFDSPFGRGRPGWHIECSAMINGFAHKGKYAIDIHGGGADLIFPHHENECSQTRCALNQEIAKYWMHNAFVNVNGQKMSKSLGNSFFVKDALRLYDGEVLRFYLMGTHYRSPLNFSDDDVKAAKKRLDKLYRLKKRLYGINAKKQNDDFKNNLLSALSDDLNISKALSIIDDMVSFANESLDTNASKIAKTHMAFNINLIAEILHIGTKDAYEYFQMGISQKQKIRIDELIKKRQELKKNKDFKQADEIRDKLNVLNVKIMDTANGTQWEMCG